MSIVCMCEYLPLLIYLLSASSIDSKLCWSKDIIHVLLLYDFKSGVNAAKSPYLCCIWHHHNVQTNCTRLFQALSWRQNEPWRNLLCITINGGWWVPAADNWSHSTPNVLRAHNSSGGISLHHYQTPVSHQQSLASRTMSNQPTELLQPSAMCQIGCSIALCYWYSAWLDSILTGDEK